ncbi:hypothetical protein FB451DRAFT_1398595 [Mycena latifolia]|nr:hypothetical protein FB451DRAFT_1398595 [Mycena latifolia]
MHPLLHAALTACPLASDKPGCFYLYIIKRPQPKAPNRHVRRAAIKMGRSEEPPEAPTAVVEEMSGTAAGMGLLLGSALCRQIRCVFSSSAQCALLTCSEQLLHTHYKLAGAWLGQSACNFCTTCHQEKYDLGKCGGRSAVIGVVESYLGHMGWPIIRTDMDDN